MNQLQDLYEYLNKASMSGMSERSANHVSAAIAIVKQMMQAKPVAGIYENRKVSIGAPDSRDVENGWSPLFTAPQAVQLFEAQPVRDSLSEERIIELGHRMATKYTHRSDPTSHAYGFVKHTLVDFVRAIERAHGIGGDQ